jgi:hypothetical protein
MEERIRIIDVPAVRWTEIINLRPRPGVVAVDSYFTERAPGAFTIDADVLRLVQNRRRMSYTVLSRDVVSG